jgi:hypothetical protein
MPPSSGPIADPEVCVYSDHERGERSTSLSPDVSSLATVVRLAQEVQV